MSDTYCQKSCTSCTYREQLQCPGCQAGPGRPLNTECEIALCCREKGHETCNTCLLRTDCSAFRRREYIPEHLQRMKAYEAENRARMAESIVFFAKWLWLLFLLAILNLLASLMTSDTVKDFMPTLNRPGEILGTVASLANALILLKLSTKNETYRKSAYGNLTLMAINLFVLAFGTHIVEASMTILFAVILTGISLYSFYAEVQAHADTVTGISNELAESWHNLWRWYMYALGTSLGALLLTTIIPFLGLIIALGASIALFVVSILKLVYLYRTAKLFRDYPMVQLD